MKSLLAGIALYVVVAVLVFTANVSIGPVTFALALLRAVLWPLWIAGMIQGQRMTVD